MATITMHALRVYSALAALRGADGDILDAIVPFFDPILKVMDGKLFDPRHLALGVQKMYHWKFTREVAEQFVPRLERLGYLKRVSDGVDAAYGVTYQEISDVQPSDDMRKIFEEIVDEFQRFPPLLTDLLNFQRDRNELADILIRFLVSSEAFGQASVVPEPHDSDELNLTQKLEEGGKPLLDDERYLAARFVQHLSETRGDLIAHLARLSAIGLLTEVINDFVRPTTATEKTDLIIFLDAPLALDYLGLSGTTIKEDVRSVFDALRRIGCKLVVFPITCDEMSRNLNRMLALQPPRRFGPTHQAMLKGEVVVDFVKLVANRPEDALRNVGIDVRPMNLTQFPNTHKYFEKERYEDFFSSIHWVKDVEPREHDATCFTLLMRLREGKHSSDIFRSKFVFATRNSAFARRSRQYCLDSHLLDNRQEGPVVHQRELATVAWLRTGLGSDSTIPRSNLIAHCDQVLRVRPEVANAMRARLADVTPEKLEQFELLLLDHRSVRRMADATLNDERIVTGENATHLLELMRKATAADVQKVYEAKLEEAGRQNRRLRREEKKAHVAELSEASSTIEALKAQVASLVHSQRFYEDNSGLVVSAAVGSVNRRASVLKATVSVILLLMGAGFVINLFVGYFGEQDALWRYALALVGAYGIYDMVASLLHWPSWGLRDLANWYAKWTLGGELTRRGISWLTSDEFDILDGRVTMKANTAGALHEEMERE